jgi:hypothetical protein
VLLEGLGQLKNPMTSSGYGSGYTAYGPFCFPDGVY